MAPGRLAALAAVDLQRLPLVAQGSRLGAPVAGTRQFVAIGLNYRRHAEESGLDIPKEPVVFHKALSSLAGPDDEVRLPEASVATDWEIELGFVIGTRASRIPVEGALAHVAGYLLANDISERDWQIKRNGQWGKGKSFDGFGPVGPWLVTTDELPDSIELTVLGALRLTQLFTPALAESDGSVVNINSMVLRHSQERYGSYKMAKSALLAMSQSLATELGPQGIRVNSIAPGYIWGRHPQGILRAPGGEVRHDRRADLRAHCVEHRPQAPADDG